MPPPPRGRSARSAPCARAELCLFSTVPATFQQPVPATFWRSSSGHWNVARTSPEQVVGTSPEQGVWVGLASLRHPCLQDGMTETEALGAALAPPPPPAPLGAQGATRSEPRSSSALASPALPHLRALPNILRGQPPLTGHRSRHGLPHKGPRQLRLSKRIASSCPSPRLGAQ